MDEVEAERVVSERQARRDRIIDIVEQARKNLSECIADMIADEEMVFDESWYREPAHRPEAPSTDECAAPVVLCRFTRMRRGIDVAEQPQARHDPRQTRPIGKQGSDPPA